ncbi:hypothetical protein BH10PLA2_BH10PLA2_09320 [soil metagenome]
MGVLPQIKELGKTWDLVLATALAFVAYFGLVDFLVGHLRIMPPHIGRLIAENDFIQNRLAHEDHPFLTFLGSSVTVEGIDCHLIDAELKSVCESFNLAWNGSSPRLWLLLAPHLAAAKPKMVVLCVDAAPVAENSKILPVDLAVASWWKLIPQHDLLDLSKVLTVNELEQLGQSDLMNLFVFRSLLPGALDSTLREKARRDLRFNDYLVDFKAPWVQRTSVDSVSLQKHLRLISNRMADSNEAKWAARYDALRYLTHFFSSKECKVALAIMPLNPRLDSLPRKQYLNRVRAEVADIARDRGIPIYDCSDLLGEADFSDAVHTTTSGRKKLSERLGMELHAALVR